MEKRDNLAWRLLLILTTLAGVIIFFVTPESGWYLAMLFFASYVGAVFTLLLRAYLFGLSGNYVISGWMLAVFVSGLVLSAYCPPVGQGKYEKGPRMVYREYMRQKQSEAENSESGDTDSIFGPVKSTKFVSYVEGTD